jgi:hypothetical protein
METIQNTSPYHDDRKAQVLLERIKEKMLRMRAKGENPAKAIQASELNQKDKQRCN